MVNELFSSPAFHISLVSGAYLIARAIYNKTKIALLHPIVVSMCLIIAVLTTLKIPYSTFAKATEFIDFLLGPTVVALGLLLYDQIKYIKGNVVAMSISIFIGSLTSILSVIILGNIIGLEDVIIRSLEPKSVTTPIAIGLSENINGLMSLTAVAVLINGVVGAVFGPKLLQLIGVKSPIAKGLAIGAAAHGLGTAKAMELGAIEGAISGLAIGLMGVATSLTIPLVGWMMRMI